MGTVLIFALKSFNVKEFSQTSKLNFTKHFLSLEENMVEKIPQNMYNAICKNYFYVAQKNFPENSKINILMNGLDLLKDYNITSEDVRNFFYFILFYLNYFYFFIL